MWLLLLENVNRCCFFFSFWNWSSGSISISCSVMRMGPDEWALYACVSHTGFHGGQYFANVNTMRGKILQNTSKLLGINLSNTWRNKILVCFVFTSKVKGVNNFFTVSCGWLHWVIRRMQWKRKPSALMLGREFFCWNTDSCVAILPHTAGVVVVEWELVCARQLVLLHPHSLPVQSFIRISQTKGVL